MTPNIFLFNTYFFAIMAYIYNLCMKKILFLTPYVPSSRAGGENFTRLLLEELSKSNYIDLLYYRYADDPSYVCPNENVKVVKEIINSTFLKLKNYMMYPFVHPIFSVRFNRRVLKFVEKLVAANNYDFLYLDHSQMALYGKYFPKMQKILMSHDVMAQRFSRQGNALSKALVLKGEKSLMQLPNTTVFTFSEKDRKIIRNEYGIDSRVTNFYLDDMVVNAYPRKIEKQLVFMGKWKRADNYDGIKWFFDNVYNNIDKSYKIIIIGKWLPDDFVAQIKNLPNVEYLGFVDNPYDLIANSTATISPIFSGAGVKVKVVESLACGTPVIGNEIAFEGISEEFSNFMIYANDPKMYADKINGLDINLNKRVDFKKSFLNNYQKQLISKYINSL